MEIQFTIQIFKEGKLYVAYAPQLDVSSCGGTEAKARKNLLEAVHLFLEEADRMGTLDQILDEAGFVRRKQTLEGHKFISTQRAVLPLVFADAKA
jgi:predicted RNase H-like HicB family nuclease